MFAMKRLIPLFIIATFLFAISGGVGDRLQARPEAYSSNPVCPQLSTLPPGDDFSGKPEVVEQASVLNIISCLIQDHRGNLFSWNRPSLTAPQRDHFPGLGCGGLPS
jgi:hypothetical protein